MIGLKIALALSLRVLRSSYAKMAGKLKTTRCEAIDAAEIEPTKHVSSVVLTRSFAKCLKCRRCCGAWRADGTNSWKYSLVVTVYTRNLSFRTGTDIKGNTFALLEVTIQYTTKGKALFEL